MAKPTTDLPIAHLDSASTDTTRDQERMQIESIAVVEVLPSKRNVRKQIVSIPCRSPTTLMHVAAPQSLQLTHHDQLHAFASLLSATMREMLACTAAAAAGADADATVRHYELVGQVLEQLTQQNATAHLDDTNSSNDILMPDGEHWHLEHWCLVVLLHLRPKWLVEWEFDALVDFVLLSIDGRLESVTLRPDSCKPLLMTQALDILAGFQVVALHLVWLNALVGQPHSHRNLVSTNNAAWLAIYQRYAQHHTTTQPQQSSRCMPEAHTRLQSCKSAIVSQLHAVHAHESTVFATSPVVVGTAKQPTSPQPTHRSNSPTRSVKPMSNNATTPNPLASSNPYALLTEL
jgi:hypothetical protein